MTSRTVVYPGSFNPITNGHTDLVERALKLFDKVILAIGTSAQKDPKTDLADRIALCKSVLSEHGARVEVEGFNTLLVDYAALKGTPFILRGLRTVTDFDYEFQMAQANSTLKGFETIFIPSSPEYGYLSSSMVKEIHSYGGDIKSLVPDYVLERMNNG